MSCNTCAKQAAGTLGAVGVPASQVQAVWAMVHQHLPRCTACGCWVSPRDGVCNNPGCGARGQRVAEPLPWPPEGIRFTTDSSRVGSPAQSEPGPPGGSAGEAPGRQGAGTSNADVTVSGEMTPGMTVPARHGGAARAFARMRQEAQAGQPVTLEPLGPGAGGEGRGRHGLPLPRIDFGLRQPDHPMVVEKPRLWSQYEYGTGRTSGVVRRLPFAGCDYEIGMRFLASSGVGADVGRDGNRATTAGAMLPFAADLAAAEAGQIRTIESGDLVLWCAEEPMPDGGGPLRCPRCSAFVSPGKPCARCGAVSQGRTLAAVYDKGTGQAACFVPGCPGVVQGRPCPHQLGAMAVALAEDDVGGDLEAQFLETLTSHRNHRTVESAVTAGDAAYVLIKGRGHEEMAFGCADVAGRAREAFGGAIEQSGASDGDGSGEADARGEIVRCLGEPRVPVPAGSEAPTAGHDPDFVVTEQVEGTLRMMGAGLRLGYSPNARGMMGRAFGLYGPPGTGKNAVFRETAAALGLPCREIDLGRGADLQALIGEVVLEPDGRGGTRSVAKLGPLGKALVRGEVVVLNEVVHTDPDSQTLLHQIAQDGKIQLHNPEGADRVYRVHPSSVLGMTWNPKGGVQDRPTDALYSRLFSRRIGYPDAGEETERLTGWARGRGIPDVQKDDVERVVTLLNDVRELSRRGGVDIPPSFRDGQRFLLQWKLTGDVQQGLEQLRGLASQLDDHGLQWKELTTLFERHFGHLA